MLLFFDIEDEPLKLLVFDTESCTGSRFDGSLCEFGYCVCDENFNLIKQENILINPAPPKFKLGRYGEEPAIKLAYTEEEYRRHPSFPAVYDSIGALFSEDTVAVGFSMLNDIYYLNNACEACGREKIRFNFLDVTLLYMILHKENKQPGLAAMAAEFGVDFTSQGRRGRKGKPGGFKGRMRPARRRFRRNHR